MKISKKQLKSMIMEELQSVISEQVDVYGGPTVEPSEFDPDRTEFYGTFEPGGPNFVGPELPLDQPAREAFTKRGARRAARDLRADDGLRKNLGRAGRQKLRSQFPGRAADGGVAGTRRSTYRMADIDAIAGRVAQPAMEDPRADLVNALAANAAGAQTEVPRPAPSSPSLSPEETRAVNFRGAGGYTYAQDPNDPGSFYFSGPGGKTGYAKAGTPEARSIQAEMETGTSLYHEHLATPNITEMIYEALLEEFGK